STSSSNFHTPLNAPTVMSNTPFERREMSTARSITANVSSETFTGLTPALVLTCETSESASQVVISLSSRFISVNTASAACAAARSSGVHIHTVTLVPIAWSVYWTLAGGRAPGTGALAGGSGGRAAGGCGGPRAPGPGTGRG